MFPKLKYDRAVEIKVNGVIATFTVDTGGPVCVFHGNRVGKNSW